MNMNTARSGRDRENKLKCYLERAFGWHVIRAAASKGPFDLVGIERTERGILQVWLIQVKGRDWPRGKELDELFKFAEAEGDDTKVSVVRFKKRSSVVEWVDLCDVLTCIYGKISIPWSLHTEQIDLRKELEGGEE